MDKFEQHIKRMKGLRDVYEVGTGQHNILSMLIKECEEALRQPPVSGRVYFSSDCFYHDKTTDTCVGDYAKCTVKQTHR